MDDMNTDSATPASDDTKVDAPATGDAPATDAAPAAPAESGDAPAA